MAVWNLLSSLEDPEVRLLVANEDRASSVVKLGASRSESSMSGSAAAEISMMHLNVLW